MIFFVIINAVFIGLEHAYEGETYDMLITYSNVTLTAIFMIECTISILGLGFVQFISDEFNALDFFVVLFSVVDIAQGNHGLTAFKSLRLLRMFKFARFSAALRNQLSLMAKAFDHVIPYLMLLTLLLFSYAVVGMYLFGGKYVAYCEHEY